MNSSQSEIWKQPEVAQAFVQERARLLPHREEQLEIMVRVLRGDGARSPRRALDLGCGSGVLLGAALAAFPDAEGVGVDFSPSMLATARKALAPIGERAAFAAADLARPDWAAALPGPFDVV